MLRPSTAAARTANDDGEREEKGGRAEGHGGKLSEIQGSVIYYMSTQRDSITLQNLSPTPKNY